MDTHSVTHTHTHTHARTHPHTHARMHTHTHTICLSLTHTTVVYQGCNVTEGKFFKKRKVFKEADLKEPTEVKG